VVSILRLLEELQVSGSQYHLESLQFFYLEASPVLRVPHDPHDPRDHHDPRGPHDPRDPHDPRGPRGPHDPRDPHDLRGPHDPHAPLSVLVAFPWADRVSLPFDSAAHNLAQHEPQHQ
jgi:hypothetical protein